jgi:hypothetical protein
MDPNPNPATSKLCGLEQITALLFQAFSLCSAGNITKPALQGVVKI